MKNLLYLLPLLTVFLSCKEATRTSRHTPFCSCEHEIDGKKQILEIAPQNMEEVLDEMVTLTGLPSRVFNMCGVQMKGTVGMATLHQGRYAIYVDPRLEEYSRITHAFTIGHEMAHALSNFLDRNDVTDHRRELECDFFAGNMIARMGISLEQALDDLDFFFSGEETDSHPEGNLRKEWFIQGYRQAQQSFGTTVMN